MNSADFHLKQGEAPQVILQHRELEKQEERACQARRELPPGGTGQVCDILAP